MLQERFADMLSHPKWTWFFWLWSGLPVFFSIEPQTDFEKQVYFWCLFFFLFLTFYHFSWPFIKNFDHGPSEPSGESSSDLSYTDGLVTGIIVNELLDDD